MVTQASVNNSLGVRPARRDAAAIPCARYEPLLTDVANNVSKLNPFGESFTLEKFIFNQKNLVPLALARGVVTPHQQPNYNPLLYYGKPGSGKTHLLRAIANKFTCYYNSFFVFYGNITQLLLEGEDDARCAAIDRYQAYCVDDIQLCAENIPLQEKFVAFLETSLIEQKQVVCACSDAFHKGLTNNLRFCLERGRIVQLKKPDIDVRMRFIQTQSCLHHLTISRENILLLAQRCEHIRYIAQVLLKIAAYKTGTQREITEQDIKKFLRQASEHGPIMPQAIIRLVAEYFSLQPEDIMGEQRKPAPVFARQVAMYLCREILDLSYSVLGDIFGGKNHSTVMYSIKKIEKYIVMHKNMHNKIIELKNMCAKKNDDLCYSGFHTKLT